MEILRYHLTVHQLMFSCNDAGITELAAISVL